VWTTSSRWSLMSTVVLTSWPENLALSIVTVRITQLRCVHAVLPPGTRYQRTFQTHPHHIPVSAVLELNYLVRPMALTYLSTFVIAFRCKNGRIELFLLNRTAMCLLWPAKSTGPNISNTDRMRCQYLVSDFDKEGEDYDNKQVVENADSCNDDVDDLECKFTKAEEIWCKIVFRRGRGNVEDITRQRWVLHHCWELTQEPASAAVLLYTS